MPRPAGRRDLTALEKLEIVAYLTVRQRDDGTLPRGAKSEAAATYGCHRNTVDDVWERREALAGRVGGGSAPKHTAEEISNLVASVPVYERTCLRSTAAGVGIPHTTLSNYVGKGKPLRRATGCLKPKITAEHKVKRLRFVLMFVERPLGLRTRRFNAMYDTVHIDEKWFYLYKTATSYILTAKEMPPYLQCENKKFITKVMFIAAVARPHYDYLRKEEFDGKIGIFPIVQKRLAKRTTKNQTAGDPITKARSVDKNVYRELLRDSILPAIQANWPGRKQGTIFIQQDNASPHVSAETLVSVSEAGLDRYGWDVQIRRQPAKSPDLNILDLGYFHAIQTLQHRKQAYNIDSLISAVEDSFREMEVKTLEKCFLTLKALMEQIMLAEGGNEYSLPHVKKKHSPNGVSPSSIPCSELAFHTAIEALNKAQNNDANT